MGKALWDSKGEAAAMQGKIAVSIKAQIERAGGRSGDTVFGSAHLTHRPHGVMAVFGPFNFPGHLPNGHIVPALLAGNTCVFKPSELAPAVAELMVECFEAAGLPPGVVNVVHGGRQTGAALLEADINGVLFTGSASTGTAFHRHFAGRPDVILALEMGGNNPLIIWDPADIDAAADIAAQSAFLTTGQRCSCARRIFLPEGQFGDEVVEALVERARGIRIGAWNEEDVFMGPLVSEKAADAAQDGVQQLMDIMSAYDDSTLFRPGGTAKFAGERTISIMDILNGVERFGADADQGDPIQMNGWGYNSGDGTYNRAAPIRSAFEKLARKPYAAKGLSGEDYTLRFEVIDDRKNGSVVFRMNKEAA